MDDAELIEFLGGSARLANKLGMHERGATQRVNNWKRRGIPPKVRLEHAEVFAAAALTSPPASPPAAQEAA